MSRALLAGGGALMLAVAGVALFRHAGASTDALPMRSDTSVGVSLVSADVGWYLLRVHAQGRVGVPSGGDAKLSFAVSGIVARVDVRVGQAVLRGEPLAQLDTGGLSLDLALARSDASAVGAAYAQGTVPIGALASARARITATRDRLRAFANGLSGAQSDREAALAGVRQAKARLDADRAALDRTTTLYAGGIAARKDVEAARAQLAFDRADADAAQAKAGSTGANVSAALTQARADVAQAESDARAAQAQVTVSAAQAIAAQTRYAAARRIVALATLRATAAGVVTAILKQPGESVDPTQPAIVVGPAASADVTLAVAGQDMRDVRTGDSVSLRLTNRDGSGTGRVRAIVPGVDAATQMSTVVVAGSPPGAVSGDAVEATIEVAKRRGIVIPTAAIIEDPESGKSIVFVRERASDGSQKFVSREIRVAAGDDTRTLIAGGLRAGERIATQGAFDLLAPSGG